MRIPTRVRQLGVSLNLTPLIDIVFLLVIFFLVASHAARTESTEPVDLPTIVDAEDDRIEVPRRLVVTVTSDQSLHVGGRIVTLEQVSGLLKDAGSEAGTGGYEVRIRGDRRVPFRVVEPLMVACAQAGITRIGYAVLPE
ncbi:MAG TPA: biopolymer transporter ExbD [Planctomycetaceae bacterium]|nr:biopolymer transporter ExbD [Planctomycetaceae bacterium]HCC98985.1 biopolymer transporter ExbD [Planctomycetaceae bacterium]|tara:strand:- start:1039 stop:1458 length:420 start_codon:yes stop_codon:yes gene_type:complete